MNSQQEFYCFNCRRFKPIIELVDFDAKKRKCKSCVKKLEKKMSKYKPDAKPKAPNSTNVVMNHLKIVSERNEDY